MKAQWKWVLPIALAAPLLVLNGCTTQKGRCCSTRDKTGCGGCGTCASVAKPDGDCATGVCGSRLPAQARAKADKPAAPAYSEINTPALATLLNSGASVVVLDARTGQWDDGRRLPGAKALAPSATEAEALAAIGAKDALVVTYCSHEKCPASMHLANRLLELGFTNVLKYPEGIDDWQAKGHEIVRAN